MHIVYNVTLVRSYRRNDLAQAYPIGAARPPCSSSLVGSLVSIAAYGIVI